MKTLNDIAVSHLRVGEAADFVRNTILNIKNTKIDLSKDRRTNNYITSLFDSLTEYSSYLYKTKKNSHTQAVADADNLRDNLFKSLYKQYNVYSFNINEPAKDKAYEVLSLVFDKYLGIPTMNYAEETTAIIRLLEDLNDAKNSPSVAILGLQSFVQRLSDANEAFMTINSVRTLETPAKPDKDGLTVRKEMFKIYADFADYILSSAKDDLHPEKEMFIRFLNIINYIRKYYDDMLRARRNRGDSEADIPPPSPVE